MVSFPKRSYLMGGESGSSAFNKEKTLIGTFFGHCESPVDSSIPRSSPSPCNLPLKEEPQREAITVTERFLHVTMGFNVLQNFHFQRILDYQRISKPASILLSQILDRLQHHHHFFIDLIFNTNNNINFGKNWSPHLQIAEEIALLSLNAFCSMIHGRLKRAAKRCSWGPCCVPCQYLQLFTASNKTHLSPWPVCSARRGHSYLTV